MWNYKDYKKITIGLWIVFLVTWLVNEYMSPKGFLMENGSMSYLHFFQWKHYWCAITHMYIQQNFFYLIINGMALFFILPLLENKMGSLKAFGLFNVIGILESILGSYIISQESIVGCTSAIIGCISFIVIQKEYRNIPSNVWMFLILYVMYTSSSISGFVYHSVAIVLGALIGIILKKGR